MPKIIDFLPKTLYLDSIRLKVNLGQKSINLAMS